MNDAYWDMVSELGEEYWDEMAYYKQCSDDLEEEIEDHEKQLLEIELNTNNKNHE